MRDWPSANRHRIPAFAAHVLGQRFHCLRRKATGLVEFGLDPFVGKFQALLQGNRRLPTEYLVQTGVIAVASADTLRLTQFVALHQRLTCNPGNEIDQFVDGNQAVCAEIKRLMIVGSHQANQTLYTIVDIHERAGLLTVAPNLDFASVRRQRDLTGNGGWSFFLPAVVRAKWAVNIVETHCAGLESIIVT